MTVTITPQYLKRVAAIDTPERIPEEILRINLQEYGDFNGMEFFRHDYAELRNAAKDLLRDSKDRDARLKLSSLVRKLEVKSV